MPLRQEKAGKWGAEREERPLGMAGTSSHFIIIILVIIFSIIITTTIISLSRPESGGTGGSFDARAWPSPPVSSEVEAADLDCVSSFPSITASSSSTSPPCYAQLSAYSQHAWQRCERERRPRRRHASRQKRGQGRWSQQRAKG